MAQAMSPIPTIVNRTPNSAAQLPDSAISRYTINGRGAETRFQKAAKPHVKYIDDLEFDRIEAVCQSSLRSHGLSL